MADKLETFELFPLLPLQIRETIWRKALPSDRICHVEVVSLEVICEFREYERREEMKGEILWRELSSNREEKDGEGSDEEEMEYCPKKDLSWLAHQASHSRGGKILWQTQLEKYDSFSCAEPELIRAFIIRYGFQSSQQLPYIYHIRPYENFWTESAVEIQCQTPFPPLLQVCRESREFAIRSSYALTSAAPWVTGKKWINLHTDFFAMCCADAIWRLPDYLSPFKLHRIRRLGLCSTERYCPNVALRLLDSYRNLEELAFIVNFCGDQAYEICAGDFIIAEICEDYISWNGYALPFDHVKKIINTFSEELSCFGTVDRGDVQNHLGEAAELVITSEQPKPKVPRFRLVYMIDRESARKLEVISIQLEKRRRRIRFHGGVMREFPGKGKD